MHKRTYTLVTGLVLLCLGTACMAAGVNDFKGTWLNADKNTRRVTTLTIMVKGRFATVHAWGKCHPKDCNWGTTAGRFYKDGTLRASYGTKIAVRSLVFRVKTQRTMSVQVMTHYIDKSRRNDRRSVETFNRSAAVRPGRLPQSGTTAGGVASAARLAGRQCRCRCIPLPPGPVIRAVTTLRSRTQ